MRVWIAASILCIAAASAGTARAAPSKAVADSYKTAVQQYQDRDYQRALELVDQGLAIAPRHLDLLFLRASILLALSDRAAAIAAYQACLDAGAKGRNRQEAQLMIRDLKKAQPTSVEIAAANGPTAIHLDLAQKPTCTADPSCLRVVSPGRHRVVAERPGFERWTGNVTVAKGATAQLAITLTEKPSPLTVRVAPPAARVTVDGAPYTGAAKLAAGNHRVAVALAGHRDEHREVVAHEGTPIELDVALLPIVPVRVAPATATLLLGGEPVALEAGGLALPPGPLELIARAPGFVDRRVVIPAERPADYQIAVELQHPPPPPPPASWFTTRRKLALAAAVVGVGAATTGVVFGIQSSRRDREARALCPSQDLGCDDAIRANDLNRRAQDRALQANVAYGIASAAAAAAAILWFTGGPESRIALAPQVGGAGLTMAGTF
jgi:hypothetical protein